MDKIIYELLNLGLDNSTRNCEIDDISLTWDNEITLCTAGGKVYKITIEEDNKIYDEI